MTGYFHCLCADQELASAFGESVRGEARFAADGTLDVIDLTVILGVIHAKRRFGAQSVANPRILATLVKLERLFEREYPINRNRPANCAPAMGRYAGDRYFGGGAYYFSTLATAQFYYCLAETAAAGAEIVIAAENRTILAELLGEKPETLGIDRLPPIYRARLSRGLLDRGDMFMAIVRRYIPDSREMAEQFSQIDGAPASAKNLT